MTNEEIDMHHSIPEYTDPLPTGTYIRIDPLQHGEEKFKRHPKDVYDQTHNDYDEENKL